MELLASFPSHVEGHPNWYHLALQRHMVTHRAPERAILSALPLLESRTVLLVDDERHVLTATGRILEGFKMIVFAASTTADALRVIGLQKVDVALIDWRLEGGEDGLALGRALKRDRGIPFVLFSGYLTTEATAHAVRTGAADVIDKPLSASRLIAALDLALHERESGLNDPLRVEYGSDPIGRRWARVVLRACSSTKDPNTESAIAAASAVSTSVFRKICDACRVNAKDTRDLARFLRAIARSREDGSDLGSHLSASDPRTRARLFERAALSEDSVAPSLHRFIFSQCFIPTNKECLQNLTHLAANDPLFFAEFRVDERGKAASRQEQ